MNTINGCENGYDLPPQTSAARTLQALGRQGASLVEVTDGPSRLQTYMYFDTEAVVEHPVELYDYVSDGVVFETVTNEFEAPVEIAGRPAKSLLKILAGRGIFELDMTDKGNEKVTLSAHGHLTIQKPSVTYRQAKAVAMESGKALQAATKVSGKTLLETVKEELKPPEATKPTKEAVAAVAFVCGQIVTQYSERLGTSSIVDLIGAIRMNYPELTKDPQFRSVINRFSKDPEGFKQSIAGLDRQAIVEELPMVPAFHEICDTHAINPNEILEI